MSTTPQLSPLEQLGQSVQQQAAPAQQQTTPSQPQLSPLEQLGQSVQKQQTPQPVDPQQYASDTRQMLVSGLTGMPTPNMTEQDKSSFAAGKATGAGTATLLSVAPLLGALAPHLPTLDKAWKIATLLGGASVTVDHLLHIMGVLNSGKK